MTSTNHASHAQWIQNSNLLFLWLFTLNFGARFHSA